MKDIKSKAEKYPLHYLRGDLSGTGDIAKYIITQDGHRIPSISIYNIYKCKLKHKIDIQYIDNDEVVIVDTPKKAKLVYEKCVASNNPYVDGWKLFHQMLANY